MSEAYSIQAKLTLDTSKFASEINKITKNIKNLSSVFSSALGGEFEKTAKNIKTSYKALNSALSEEFKKSTTKIANQTKKIRVAYAQAFDQSEKNAKKASSNIQSNFSLLSGGIAKVAAVGGVTAGVFSIMHKGLERFSIIKDFPKQMSAFGISAKDASKSIDNLKDGIVGLPVSLADTVAQTQKLYATTRDMDKSTKLVLALNGAFAATKADAIACETAFRHFNKGLSEGKVNMLDMNEISFAMGPALDKVAKGFGYADGQTKVFEKDLIEGKITMQQFADKLADMNTELTKVGKEAGGGVSTSLANLNNAFASLGAAAWEALEDISIALTGTDIQGNVEKLTSTVKNFTNTLKKMFPKDELKEGSEALKDAIPKDEFLVGIGNIIKFATALGALAVGFVVVAKIAGVAVGIFNAIGVVLGVIAAIAASTAAPFIAIGLVVGAVVGIIIWHFNDICTFLSGVINFICKEFDDMGIDLRAIWNWICSSAKWLWDSITGAIVGAWNYLSAKASEIFEGIKSTVVGIFNSISSKVSEIWDGIKATIKRVWNSIKDIFEKVTGFFGGGGTPKTAAISLDESTFSAQEFLYEHNINHKINSLLHSSNFSYDTNVKVNTPQTNVYVLLDSQELAAKSFSSISDLINAKTLIKTSHINGAW